PAVVGWREDDGGVLESGEQHLEVGGGCVREIAGEDEDGAGVAAGINAGANGLVVAGPGVAEDIGAVLAGDRVVDGIGADNQDAAAMDLAQRGEEVVEHRDHERAAHPRRQVAVEAALRPAGILHRANHRDARRGHCAASSTAAATRRRPSSPVIIVSSATASMPCARTSGSSAASTESSTKQSMRPA